MQTTIVERVVKTFQIFAVLGAALLFSSNCLASESPNQAIVEQVMKSNWDKAATDFNPKSELTINSVRFGKAYVATLKEVQIEGIPESAMVTPAVIDFTVRTYYNSETRADRRVREALVYQDKMEDWSVMTGSVKGQDVSTVEPAQ